MDQPVLKQGHLPYRRGERRRKPFSTEQTISPTPEGDLFPQTAPGTPVRGVVLLVEPEATLRWRLGNALVNRGYSVAEAAAARQATELFTQGTFDLLLLDLDLPDDTSGSVLRTLAASHALAPPVIILPKRQGATEQTDTAPLGTVLPEPSWWADLLRLVEHIRSAPGPPGSPDAEAEADTSAGWEPVHRLRSWPIVSVRSGSEAALVRTGS